MGLVVKSSLIKLTTKEIVPGRKYTCNLYSCAINGNIRFSAVPKYSGKNEASMQNVRITNMVLRRKRIANFIDRTPARGAF